MSDIEKIQSDNVSDINEPDEPYGLSKERKVIIQPYDYAVRTLMDMISEGDLILDPDYQREYRWEDEKASRFIESIILNIPVPVVYLAEEDSGVFSVIDGQQRLTSLFRFVRSAELNSVFPDRELEPLVLENLKVRSDLNGKTYQELDTADRSALAKRPIRCISVLSESDPTLKFEVFERLNTGSASLTEQEVRNCMYRGGLNELIKELAAYPKFQELISLPERYKKTMKAEELVLRYLAYRDFNESVNYSGSYNEYLNHYMIENSAISNARQESIKRIFFSTVDTIYQYIKPGRAFRRPDDRYEVSSYSAAAINGAIYESQMIAISKLIEAGQLKKKGLEKRISSSFACDDYWSALFQGTAKKHKILKRNKSLFDKLK